MKPALLHPWARWKNPTGDERVLIVRKLPSGHYDCRLGGFAMRTLRFKAGSLAEIRHRCMPTWTRTGTWRCIFSRQVDAERLYQRPAQQFDMLGVRAGDRVPLVPFMGAFE